MSIVYTVVADISSHFERGKILDPMLAYDESISFSGPVIGRGTILESSNAIWRYWALFIFGVHPSCSSGGTLPTQLGPWLANGAVAPKCFDMVELTSN